MADSLTLYELPPSPNNVRARLALKIKGLPYEQKLVGFQDRDELIALSGQPLTPVLKHGERVIFDSSAILRYLDANFLDTPRLFSADRDEMHAIEEWEYFSRVELIKPVVLTFEQAFAEQPDAEALARANALLHETTARIEQALAQGPWLLGDRLSAADLFAGPLVATGLVPEHDGSGILSFFSKNLRLGAGRERTKAWVTRLMAHD